VNISVIKHASDPVTRYGTRNGTNCVKRNRMAPARKKVSLKPMVTVSRIRTELEPVSRKKMVPAGRIDTKKAI
jgi:hypothetical protein